MTISGTCVFTMRRVYRAARIITRTKTRVLFMICVAVIIFMYTANRLSTRRSGKTSVSRYYDKDEDGMSGEDLDYKDDDEAEIVEIPLKPCPTIPIVAGEDGGRLGNKLWEYATVWSLAKMLRRPGYVPESILGSMRKMFVNPRLSALEDVSHCEFDLGKRHLAKELLPIGTIGQRFKNRHVHLAESIQIPEAVHLYRRDLAKEFRLRPELVGQVHQTVREVGGEGKVLVGVHVRRTDFSWLVPIYFNVTMVGQDFFLDAMDWFRKHVKGPLLFLIVSDDLEWCRKNLLDEKDVVMASKTPEHDLALLSLSNHTIIDYGTFGYWGAWMAGGHTVTLDCEKPLNKAMLRNKNWHVFKRSKYAK